MSASEPFDASGKARLAGLGIALAGLAAYSGSFSGPFVFDDVPSIPANPTIRHLWPPAAVLHPPAAAGVAGRPLLNLSFALNYAIGGLDVGSYHALNLAIHLAAGLALFGILRRTLERIGGKWRSDALPLAFFAALIWTLHPVQTASVTYLSQRAESLMGLFYLLTLYCFIRGARLCPLDAGSAAAVEPNLWFGLSWLACLLGMATKEVMVTAPFVVLLYDRSFLAGSFAAALRQRWRFYLGLAAGWLVLAGLMPGGQVSQSAGYGLGVTAGRYALTECWVVTHYLFLCFWPHPLVLDYGLHPAIGPAAPWALALAAILAAALALFLRRPRLGFAAAWFFIILAPTSSIVPVAFEPMAENRLYLPLAGAVVLLVLGIHALLGRRGLILLAALAIGAATLTAQRNRIYRSDVALWSDTVRACPDNGGAHNNLGRALMLSPGHRNEAIGEFRAAARLDPDDPGAHNNLANALAGTPDGLPEAVAEYRAALKLNPGSAVLHDNLGRALARTPGGWPDAAEEYRAALRIDPRDPQAWNNLGMVSERLGRTSDAADDYRAAARIDPNRLVPRLNLARALWRLGRRDEAAAAYRGVLRLDPGNAEAQARCRP